MSKYQAKAQELVDKFREFADGTDSETDRYSPGVEKEKAKQCALIAIDEILFALKYDMNEPTSASIRYWKEVKQEIEAL